MKKAKIIVITFIFAAINIILLNYYLIDEINIYHPYEIEYLDDSNQNIVNTLHEKKGLYITYEEIPQTFIDYLICIEDKTFFKHKGFNFERLIKAFFTSLTTSSTQGGSTITMQLARLLYLNNRKTIIRKFEEILYAIKIENTLSKKQILEFYLNSIYFAHGVYGLRTASFYYFGKDVKNLSLYEMAMLIGILNSPNNYSPYIDLETSKKKTQQILLTLEKNKLITINEYYDAFNNDFILLNHENDILFNGENYYLDACLYEINKRKILSEKDYKNGVIIETFLNKNLQKSIENIIHKINFDTYNVAVCVMETNTSKVISLIGGKDYNQSSFNRSINSKKQIGSTIKPLIYYLALLNGFTPLSEFKSEKTTFHIKDYGDYSVSNAGEIYANRKITMLEAIAMSDNIFAVKTLLTIGLKPLIELLNSFNIEVDVNNITLALGANSMSLLELTSIYNCIASGGIYYKPKFIKKISSGSRVIYNAKSQNGIIKMFKKECEIIRSLLRAPFDKGLKTYSNPSLMNYYISSSFGGKTGSTESSSWVIGFSKKYTIGVYVGSDDNTYLRKGYLSREIFYQIASFLNEKKLDYFIPSSSLKSFKLYNSITKEYSFSYYTN